MPSFPHVQKQTKASTRKTNARKQHKSTCRLSPAKRTQMMWASRLLNTSRRSYASIGRSVAKHMTGFDAKQCGGNHSQTRLGKDVVKVMSALHTCCTEPVQQHGGASSFSNAKRYTQRNTSKMDSHQRTQLVTMINNML